jgi:hypothetical protein
MEQSVFNPSKNNLHFRGFFRTAFILLIANVFLTTNSFSRQADKGYDFSNAVIVVPGGLTSTQEAAVQLLVEEIKKRTIIELPVTSGWPGTGVPVIAIGTRASFSGNPEFAGT